MDAGAMPDAGAPPDAGEVDAGNALDAGGTPDAGLLTDAGVLVDAGSATDSGVTNDAGTVTPDAGSLPTPLPVNPMDGAVIIGECRCDSSAGLSVAVLLVLAGRRRRGQSRASKTSY